MNFTVLIIQTFVLMAAFGILVFGMLLLNPLAFISDYPPEIQERYYRTQNKEASESKLNALMKAKKLTAVVVFVFLFALLAHKAGAETFLQGLFASYWYIVAVAAFDTLVLDWVLFANIKRIRLPGTEDMDREYHQKFFHVKVLFPVIPIAAVFGTASALLVTLIW